MPGGGVKPAGGPVAPDGMLKPAGGPFWARRRRSPMVNGVRCVQTERSHPEKHARCSCFMWYALQEICCCYASIPYAGAPIRRRNNNAAQVGGVMLSDDFIACAASLQTESSKCVARKRPDPRSLGLVCSACTSKMDVGTMMGAHLRNRYPSWCRTCKSWSRCGRARRGQLVRAPSRMWSSIEHDWTPNAARHRHSHSSSSSALPFPLGRQFQVCQNSMA